MDLSNLSIKNRKKPPDKNPILTVIQEICPNSSDKIIAGLSKDQKLAATITPAANPNIAFNIFLFIVLKKKTNDAPKAVNPQVNNVPINAWIIGDKL